METTTDTTSTPAPSGSTGLRPTFLTVICILTFIGSGWGLIRAVQGYVTADTVAAVASEAMSKAEDKMDQQETPNFVKQMFSSMTDRMNPDNIRKSSIFSLISNLLTLIGAIMMWNLKKSGFYLYIGGIIVLAVAPMIVLGKGFLGAMSAAGIGFFGVIFIVMYAVNLKHMDK